MLAGTLCAVLAAVHAGVHALPAHPKCSPGARWGYGNCSGLGALHSVCLIIVPWVYLLDQYGFPDRCLKLSSPRKPEAAGGHFGHKQRRFTTSSIFHLHQVSRKRLKSQSVFVSTEEKWLCQTSTQSFIKIFKYLVSMLKNFSNEYRIKKV